MADRIDQLTTPETTRHAAGPGEPEPWLEPAYTADEMRSLDNWAIEERGVPSLELMESAGAAVARAVSDLAPDGPVRIVCGKGNNGGDGFVAARRLADFGVEAEALLLWPPDELSPDARENQARLLSSGGTAIEVTVEDLSSALANAAVVVDALLGTGFSGRPRPPIEGAIDALNAAPCPVVAIDVPSGLDASSGEVGGACVRADTTVTFHASKLGLWVLPGKSFAGSVEVVEIGIPAEDGAPSATAGLIRGGVTGLIPRRDSWSTKFSSGSVLVVGGSTGLTGAVCMACDSAMRAGAGWVRAGVPRSLNPVFEGRLLEVMTVPLVDREGHLLPEAAYQALEAAERADAVVLGPGLGRGDDACEVVRRLADGVERPLLIDADGLNAVASLGLETLSRRSAPTVLTPHAGELARLMNTESRLVSAQRVAYAREAASRTKGTVVLKGDDTLVADAHSRRLGISTGGSPALATAGTGDVLSGVIAAFLAKGLDPFEAACAGVYVHAHAGWLASTRVGPDSVIASDVIGALPGALQRPDGD